MAIPDAPIRENALGALARKRAHTDGAALFWIIPRARNLTLLRMLAAFEIMCDFLDSVNEHGAQMGQANGRQLHLALIDALAPERPLCRLLPASPLASRRRLPPRAGRGVPRVLPAAARL